jgi:hypothetical protein
MEDDIYCCYACCKDITEEVHKEVKSRTLVVALFPRNESYEIIVSCPPNDKHEDEVLVSFELTREEIKRLKKGR